MIKMITNYRNDLKDYRNSVKGATNLYYSSIGGAVKKFYSRKSNWAIAAIILLIGFLPAMIYAGYSFYEYRTLKRRMDISNDLANLDKEFEAEVSDIDNAM